MRIYPLLTALAVVASWLFCMGPCANGFGNPTETTAQAACNDCGSGGATPSPAKQGGGLPDCLSLCLELQIAIAPMAGGTPLPSVATIGWTHFAILTAVKRPESAVSLLALGSGPPFARSFAELVLSRALCIHGPPACS